MMGERGGKQEEKSRVTVTRVELPSLESSYRNLNAMVEQFSSSDLTSRENVELTRT